MLVKTFNFNADKEAVRMNLFLHYMKIYTNDYFAMKICAIVVGAVMIYEHWVEKVETSSTLKLLFYKELKIL